MARRRQSTAEDVMEITSKFPWWVGVLLAVGSYIWLHSIANKGIPQSQGSDLTQAMSGGLIYAFASLGQYVLPFLFGFGAAISIIMSAKRKKLHHDVSSGDLLITDISWQEFEILIGEHLLTKRFRSS